MLIGCYYEIKGEATEEVIADIKKKVVNQLCRDIRKIAKENDDLFIVKTLPHLLLSEITTTVGVKVELPTIKDDI